MRVPFVKTGKITGRSLFYTILSLALSLIVIVPLMWIFFGAVKDRGRIIRNPLGLAEIWHWENFVDAWEGGNFSTYFGNSVLVVVPVVIGILFLALLAAYAFALMSFKGRDFLFILFLAGMTSTPSTRSMWPRSAAPARRSRKA
jgi:ABC-type glycerol-3-phosphate transport system permease component